jgi:hypothetical protein
MKSDTGNAIIFLPLAVTLRLISVSVFEAQGKVPRLERWPVSSIHLNLPLYALGGGLPSGGSCLPKDV